MVPWGTLGRPYNYPLSGPQSHNGWNPGLQGVGSLWGVVKSLFRESNPLNRESFVGSQTSWFPTGHVDTQGL